MNDFYVCVPYYSLPEFPNSCLVVKNHNILPRDVLLCNRTNAVHILGGMQYDPNMENGEYRICEPSVRRRLKKKANQYNELFLIFRTRYFQLDRTSKYLATGFYKINKEFYKEEREGPIIYAKDMRFVSISDSINITQQIGSSRAFRASFTSENPTWCKYLTNWIGQFEEKKDQTAEYIREIKRLKTIFRENEFQSGGYSACKSCKHHNSRLYCPLIWRQHVYRQMPHHPAHYLENLDEFYEGFVKL